MRHFSRLIQLRCLYHKQKEWIEAKGEEEVALKELEGVKAKLAANEAKMKAGSPNQEELKQKYKEQEELLGL